MLSSTEEGEASYQPVTRVFQQSGAEVVALTFTDAHGVGAPIVTTPEHPFRVASGEWVVAGRLDIGDNVVTAEGGLATLSAALSLEKSGTVYNFEVEGTHSYFVGTAKLWVHNACNRPPNKSPSGAGRKGAFNQAKRNNGVPTSRQPESTGPNLDRRGNVQPGLQYNFRDSHGNPVTIRDDSAGHSYGAGDLQNRGPHFNDPFGNHNDY